MGRTETTGVTFRTLALAGILACGALLLEPPHAFAQSSAAGGVTQTSEVRPTTTTVAGDTGLWLVPTAEVLRHKKWSLSFYEANADDGQGFMDIVRLPLTFGIGLGDRAEIFGNWSLVTRIDRDTRPLFFSSTAAEQSTGTGGGIHPDYPLIRGGWSGNRLGDLWVGGKVRVLGSMSAPVGLAIRAQVKLPVGDDAIGVSSGKADFQVDGIVSRSSNHVEVSGFGGLMVRGNPAGYKLTNGIRWGVGAAFPNIMNDGLRATAEVVGEHYLNQRITAPAGLAGDDGSPVPTETFLKNPVLLNLGLTWQAPSGFFISGGGSWNLTMKPRSAATGINVAPVPDVFGDQGALVFRIGYSSGTRRSRTSASGAASPLPVPSAASDVQTAAMPQTAPPATPPATVLPPDSAAAAPPALPAPNRPPTVQVTCDPCRVEPGQTAVVSAIAKDPDGDPLTYRWTATGGQIDTPTGSQIRWTAPKEPGKVDITVDVTDSKGARTTSATSIEVVPSTPRGYAFDDVHFDFDRSTLRPETVRVLNDVVAAMRSDPNLTLEIEGHTCNIGTVKYNQALGDRRAKAVRAYLVSMDIDPGRLRTVSYGEERPKHDNTKEPTRQFNRRAVLVVHLAIDRRD